MWRHFLSQMNTLLLWRLLFWAGWAGVLAGFFFVLLGVTIRKWRPWIATTWRSSAPRVPYIAVRIASVLSELPSVTKLAARVVPAVAFFILGWLARDMQQYNRTSSYQMKVLQRYEPYRYLVRTTKTEPFIFQVCADRGDPEFDAGMIVDVTFEDRGTCNSFAGDELGYRAQIDKATGKLIDFREVQ